MKKTVHVDGRDIEMKCTALTPIKYRERFGRDFLQDFQQLVKVDQDEQLNTDILLVFYGMAYTMAKQADPSITDDPDEWLDSFDMFPIYELLPQMVELWTKDNETNAELKKKTAK